MNLTRGHCLSVLASATVAYSQPAQTTAADLPTLQVGVLPSDFAAEAYYAKDMGFFATAGVNVEIIPVKSGAAAAAAILSGSLDFAYSNVLTLALAHDKGFGFTAVAIANIYRSEAPAGGLIGVKDASSIRVAKDLNGKTIAVGALNSITYLGARAWIEATGGDSSTIRWPEIQISAEPAAVIAGRVDAAVFDQGVYPSLGKPGDPIRVIAHAYDYIAPTFASGVWFGKSDWIAAHQRETHAFRSGIATAATWANAHHHESAVILARSLAESVEQIDASTRYVYGLTLTPQLLQPQIDLAAKFGMIRPFSARDLIGN